MKTKLFLIILFALFINTTSAQYFKQYFDGADTIYNSSQFQSSLKIEIENDSSNIWQIGMPQKDYFNSAFSTPNVLVTDTINFYPSNNTSSFQFTLKPNFNWGILAIQWSQKLDMDMGNDGGKIEFSIDTGVTWQNAFSNPFVYNFYGFQMNNQNILDNGEEVFSGTDSVWRHIWLCYDMSWIAMNDSIIVRYTFISDSINNNKEGWMIDNFNLNLTTVHTVSEIQQEDYFNIYPNPTSDIINIEIKKIQEFHIIERMELINSDGKIVDAWNNIPTKYFIDVKKYNNGYYYLKIKTNIKSETIPVVINHN